jgi:hypothetical protein
MFLLAIVLYFQNPPRPTPSELDETSSLLALGPNVTRTSTKKDRKAGTRRVANN